MPSWPQTSVQFPTEPSFTDTTGIVFSGIVQPTQNGVSLPDAPGRKGVHVVTSDTTTNPPTPWIFDVGTNAWYMLVSTWVQQPAKPAGIPPGRPFFLIQDVTSTTITIAFYNAIFQQPDALADQYNVFYSTTGGAPFTPIWNEEVASIVGTSFVVTLPSEIVPDGTTVYTFILISNNNGVNSQDSLAVSTTIPVPPPAPSVATAPAAKA